jgi:hypothetical protein
MKEGTKCKSWTTKEIDEVLELRRLGYTAKDIAEELERNVGSVIGMFNRLGKGHPHPIKGSRHEP